MERERVGKFMEEKKAKQSFGTRENIRCVCVGGCGSFLEEGTCIWADSDMCFYEARARLRFGLNKLRACAFLCGFARERIFRRNKYAKQCV